VQERDAGRTDGDAATRDQNGSSVHGAPQSARPVQHRQTGASATCTFPKACPVCTAAAGNSGRSAGGAQVTCPRTRPDAIRRQRQANEDRQTSGKAGQPRYGYLSIRIADATGGRLGAEPVHRCLRLVTTTTPKAMSSEPMEKS
jgi:hypothetical protein